MLRIIIFENYPLYYIWIYNNLRFFAILPIFDLWYQLMNSFMKDLTSNMEKNKVLWWIDQVMFYRWSMYWEIKEPRAFKIIKVHQSFTGWNILECLLKGRTVICGTVLDNVLDKIRATIKLVPNESYTSFYIQCHKL